MAIVVTPPDDAPDRRFDTGGRYEIDGGYLSIFDSKDDVVATFAPPGWSTVEVLSGDDASI